MEPVSNESVVAATVDRLRQAILTGEMAPGHPIRMREIQQTLGVSHIPIREALRQLASEGLVIAPPRRIPTVAEVGLDEVTAIYEIRRLIEIPTVQLAQKRADNDAIGQVRSAYKAFESVADDPESADYWKLHSEFHWALLAPGANSWTRRCLEPLWRGSERYVRIFVSEYAGTEHTLQMHQTLLAAFEDPDHNRIAEALLDHFGQTERVVRDGLLASAAARAGSTSNARPIA